MIFYISLVKSLRKLTTSKPGKLYDLSEENGLDTYMSMEVPVSEGDEAKEDIMLMLQRMMNHPERDPDMKVKILQVRMNMF